MTPCVIIPIYKTLPSYDEQKSYVRCLEVLGRYDIYIVCPASLDISWYNQVAILHGIRIKEQRFENIFFESISGYNRLMTYKKFYESFLMFDYMLIYQLDAYVFRDELMEWCAKGYDYVGAPWVIKVDLKIELSDVGNGGFSLRRVRTFYDTLNSWRPVVPFHKMYNKLRNNGHRVSISIVYSFLTMLGYHNSIQYWIDRGAQNEDGFWTTYLEWLGHGLSRPSPHEAMEFAFEHYPKMLYELNNKKLPFGCHAWAKCEPQFWKNYIQ